MFFSPWAVAFPIRAIKKPANGYPNQPSCALIVTNTSGTTTRKNILDQAGMAYPPQLFSGGVGRRVERLSNRRLRGGPGATELARIRVVVGIGGSLPVHQGRGRVGGFARTGRGPAIGRFAVHPKFVGVRHVLQDEPDDNYMLDRDFQKGISQLRPFNLKYDLLIFPRQLPAAIRLASAFPEQPFVLDHIAKPPIKEGALDPWRGHLQKLAELPNVFAKFPG